MLNPFDVVTASANIKTFRIYMFRITFQVWTRVKKNRFVCYQSMSVSSHSWFGRYSTNNVENWQKERGKNVKDRILRASGS